MSNESRTEYGEIRGDPYAAYRDKNKMLGLYVEQELSVNEIAERLGCQSEIVSEWLDTHEIERRDTDPSATDRTESPDGC